MSALSIASECIGICLPTVLCTSISTCAAAASFPHSFLPLLQFPVGLFCRSSFEFQLSSFFLSCFCFIFFFVFVAAAAFILLKGDLIAEICKQSVAIGMAQMTNNGKETENDRKIAIRRMVRKGSNCNTKRKNWTKKKKNAENRMDDNMQHLSNPHFSA